MAQRPAPRSAAGQTRASPKAARAAPSPPPANKGRFAELHLHLGGAVLPNILHSYLRRHHAGAGAAHALLKRYPTPEAFERYFAKPRHSLDDYLKMHKLVERIQRPTSLDYFLKRLIRGSSLFDNLAYMELRYTPYFRTDDHLDVEHRLRQMEEVVDTVSAAAAATLNKYPMRFRQILCMHSTLEPRVNRRIVELAIARRPDVCAIDLAGPDRLYEHALPGLIPLFKLARRNGLKTTAHLFETPAGCHPALLPHLDRVGHGIQIPLKHKHLLKDLRKRNQCLEVCPTSYLRTGTLKRYEDLREVFKRCMDQGVPIAICTDNSGLHQVRLPHEYESLLVADVIDFQEMAECHRASFEHAFDWRGPARAL
jgi:adenosine deaminase